MEGKGSLGPGMALSINFQKMLEVKMSVFLCRSQTFVTEELLDYSKIRTSAQQVGGKGMPKGMGTYLPPHS